MRSVTDQHFCFADLRRLVVLKSYLHIILGDVDAILQAEI